MRAKILKIMLAVFVATTACVPAQAVSLAALIDGSGSLSIGDKTFDKFFYSGSFNASAIDVSVFAGGPGQYGIQFIGNFQAPSTQLRDALIGFDVTVTDPSMYIDKITLTALGAVATGPGSYVEIVESVLLPDSIVSIGQGQVYQPGGPLTTDIALNPVPGNYQKLRVYKDILLYNPDAEVGVVALEGFQQTFAQVPEPGSLAVMALGGLGALSFIRRRK